MIKLDELIQELCPTGVAYKNLNEVCNISAGGDVPKDTFSKEKTDEYIVPIISNGIGQNSFYGYTNTAKINVPAVTIAARGTIGYAEYRDYSYFPIIRLLSAFPKDSHKLNAKYLYYCLQGKSYSVPQGGIPQLTMPEVKKVKIPVPPLPVQREIVRILDNFTELTEDLNRELAAELTARKKQYAYYRDKLLTFENFTEWRTLDDVIVSLNTGLNPRQFFKLNSDDAHNYYVTIREIQNGTIVVSDKTDRINDDALRLCNNRSNLEVGDVLFSGTGTIGETAVISEPPTNWNIKEGIYVIKPRKEVLHSRYLMYILRTDALRSAIFKKVAGGTVKSIPMAEMRNLRVPVPSLKIQKRLVEVLDNFDAICTDLNIGLPAEIEARKKQYEYYRDKLLTFREISN